MNQPVRFDAKRLREHGKRLLAAGYRRHSLYLSPAVEQLLEKNRQRGESLGVVIERLLCPQPVARPPYGKNPAADARRLEREWRKRVKHAQHEITNSQRAAAWGGSFLTRVVLYREDRKGGAIVTNTDVLEFEGEGPSL